MFRTLRPLLTGLACFLLLTANASAQTRQEKILRDREKVLADGFWIYNDLERGLQQARENKQPVLVALRCLPCEECVKLDEELIEQHAEVKPLLEKFVRVRIVAANNLDLGLFQFDTDQSFAVFFLNADGTIYGRFGTRSDQIQWADDVSIEGLARAMEGALELHADYPANKAALARKRGPRSEFARPLDLPPFKGQFGPKLDYEGNVVKSCIHCHMIGDAVKLVARDRVGKLADEILFPFPHPRTIGLSLDPKSRAAVRSVQPGSSAAKAGVLAGDQLVSLDGQPLLSIADAQWVLHRFAPQGGELPLAVNRGGRTKTLTIQLEPGWRTRDDIAWRASSWDLRRMALGGAYFKSLDAEQSKALGLSADRQGLYVAHVGLYSPHDGAHKAGLKKGDVLLSINGQDSFIRETDLLRYALNEVSVGGAVELKVEREGKPVTVKFQTTK